MKSSFRNHPRVWCVGALLLSVSGVLVLRLGFGPANDADPHYLETNTETHTACGPHGQHQHEAEPIHPVATDPTLGQFSEWMECFVQAGAPAVVDHEAEGVRLARARRVALKALIQRDPKAALTWRVPEHVRRKLPSTVQALLEESVNAVAPYEVIVACGLGEPGAVDTLERFATWSERRLRVFTYGERLDVSSKDRLSLVGIAVDDVMALYHVPVREWSRDEKTAAGIPESAWVAEGRGEQRTFTSRSELEQWIAAMQADELALGPGPARTASESSTPGRLSTFTEGRKTLLYIVCDFPDLTGFPVTTATLSNAMNTVTSHFYEASYGKVFLAPTYVPGVLRLPQSGANYTNNFSGLLADARAAALTAGYNTDAYDFYIVITDENSSDINFSYAGKAWIGSKGLHLVEPNYTLRTAAHELGHNFGLRHANYWRTDSDLPIGRDQTPGGYVGDGNNAEWVEYGHQFSLMSGISGTYMIPAAHFAPREKRHLDWLGPADIHVVTNSQSVRLYRFDSRQGVQTPRAIHVDLPATDYTGNQREYWLGYRLAFPTNGWLCNGLQMDWTKPSYGSDGSVMLDMSPYSNDDPTGATYNDDLNDRQDGTLLMGRTWSDVPAGIHITPTARGGTAPDEWMDVRIFVGAFPSNRAPAVVLTASATNAAVNGLLTFSAAASDPDGDDLAYAWEFGRPTVLFSNSLNRASVSNSWSATGDYVVRCSVSDMKGGRASTSLVVRIGSPATFRITGRVLENGRGVENARVYFSPTNMTYTDSAGGYQLVGLSAANYTVGAQKNGAWAEAAFPQPQTLGPSAFERHLGFPQAATVVVERATSPVLVSEAGGATGYVIRLGSRPTTNVSVQFTWDTNQLALAAPTLLLTPNDWLMGRTVVVAAVNDTLFESSPHTSLVAHATSSLDPNYDQHAVSTVTAHIMDNETNTPPFTTLVQPQPDSTWIEHQSIPIEVHASDTDGVVTQVCLLANHMLVAEWELPPYTGGLTGLPVGLQILRAEVWDNLGSHATSTVANVEVLSDLDADGIPDQSDPDDDGDGLTDLFEQTHFGGATNGLAHADDDEDGFSNMSEQIANTSPTNALSYFNVRAIQGRPDGLSVASAVGRFYTLQVNADLGSGNTWSNVTGQVSIPGTGGQLILTDPDTGSIRTYRLWVTQPE